MTEVYIGIGANLGERETNINNAVLSLSHFLKDLKCSCFYKTDPMDFLEQDFFLNVVVHGFTDLKPSELLEKTQGIERSGGRERFKKIPKGPRTIDLDILLYGDSVINRNNLIIPHQSMNLRKFVLIPLLELNCTIEDPRSRLPFHQHLENIENQGVYCYSLNSYNNLFL